MILAGSPQEWRSLGIVRAVELQLPYPPSANRLWRRSGKTIHKSAKYVAWLHDAGAIANSQHAGTVSGAYKISVQAVRPDKRRRDLDNLMKPISDLLSSIGVIEDDCHCEMISMRWVTVGKGIQVRVEPAGVE